MKEREQTDLILDWLSRGSFICTFKKRENLFNPLLHGEGVLQPRSEKVLLFLCAADAPL